MAQWLKNLLVEGWKGSAPFARSYVMGILGTLGSKIL